MLGGLSDHRLTHQQGVVVSHHSETNEPPCCWMADMLRKAFPATAGITMAAVDALAAQETFAAVQTAYLMKVMYAVGAQVRSSADAAELAASQAARFVPAPTREARIAVRLEQAAEQHEIAWLRRTGSPPPEPWPGGTAEQAMARFMWGDET